MASKQLKKLDFDVNTITVDEAIGLYAEERGLQKRSIGSVLAPYKDIPAMDFFREDAAGNSLAKEAFGLALSGDHPAIDGVVTDSQLTTAEKTARFTSNLLYRYVPKDAPERSFLLEAGDKPKLGEEAFGINVPPKAKNTIHINSDPAVQTQFFKNLMLHAAENPDDVPIVRSIAYGLSTGLRPNAAVGLKFYQYYPDSASLYIEAETQGAKGRAISVPLSSLSDSMVQQAIKEQREALALPNIEEMTDADKKKVAQTNIFRIKGAKGQLRNITTKDINRVLGEIRPVEKLLWDSSRREWYNTYMPDLPAGGKKGSALFRNFHTTVANKIGMSPMVTSRVQGRSLQAKEIGATGEFLTYDSAVPGNVSNFERTEAEKLANFMRGALEEARTELGIDFDTGSSLDIDQTRLTEADSTLLPYFTRSVGVDTAALPAPPKKLDDAGRKNLASKLMEWAKSTEAKGLVGVGLGAGLVASVQETYAGLKEEGATPLQAGVGTAAKTAYEVVETPAMMAMTPTKTAGPELADQPAYIPGLGTQETEFTREQTIKEMDRQRAVIDEQMERIRAYDKRPTDIDRQMNELSK